MLSILLLIGAALAYENCTSIEDCSLNVTSICDIVICDYNETLEEGICIIVSEEGNCCESDEDCVSPIDPCKQSTCTEHHECDFDYIDKNCSWLDMDNDRCTVGFCNATTNATCEIKVLGPEACPGACCLPDGSCDDNNMMDDSWCVYENGTFQGTNTTCEEVICIAVPTPSPTSVPTHAPTLTPTISPTTPPTTSFPTSSPTPAPTPSDPWACRDQDPCIRSRYNFQTQQCIKDRKLNCPRKNFC